MSAQTMRLLSTTSEQNVSTRNKTYFAYVCLVGNIKPGENSTADYGANSSKRAYLLADDETEGVDLNEDDSAIAVERSKALHELIERRCREDSDDDNKDRVKLNPSQTDESSDTENNNYNNPNILKLTKMKWLTESHNGSPDASLTSLSPVESNTSLESDDINKTNNSDRFLDTILRLDKEHNMFGLSNITIVGARPSKKIRKDEDKAVFHQTAIVQICCYKQCCRHKSNTDLPSSLKCGGCRLCCFDPVCPTCPPPGPPCGSCKSYCPAPEIPFPCPSKCQMSNGFGLQIKVVKKPKYEPTYVELTPRSSCVLQKPFAARSCHHFPRCMPPSSCFPYLMPCFWPARPSAPCSEPAHCFHNPPCPAARKPKTCIHPDEKCPTDHYCEDSSKKTKCTNLSCIGYNNEALKKEMASRF
ncbi:uncharacterized protein [Choristoneura fumiferana]|uniref:uncharacterized protein n=1 Tax=Choristoneura fumiferana TaxID=7141 RepID=UPI003D158A27